MEFLDEIIVYFQDLWDEIVYFFEDFYDEYLAEPEFLTDLQDGCSGGITDCYQYLREMPAETIALYILVIFTVIFIIFRIFYWIFGDAELW